VDKKIRSIAKGSLITFVGMLLGAGLQLFTRTILGRSLGPAYYGEFILGFTMLNMLAMIASIGLEGSIARYIAFFFERKEYDKLKNFTDLAFALGISLSVIISGFFFTLAPRIGGVFGAQEHLTKILRVFAISLPFVVGTNLVQAALRGFKRMKYFVVIQNLLVPGSRLLATVVILLIFQLDLYDVTIGYLLASILVLFFSYRILTRFQPILGDWKLVFKKADIKELLKFSLPLMGSQQLGQLRGRVDTLLLGYFTRVSEVGLYNAALPLSRTIQLGLGAINKIFMPNVTELYAKKDIDALKKAYARVAIWTFYLTLPAFVFITFFSDLLLNLLFGPEYTNATVALVVLASGFFVNSITGSFGETFVAIGKPHINFFTSVIGLTSVAVLMLFLIPSYGFLGAAISAAISLLLCCLFGVCMLYHYIRVQPFSLKHLKGIAGVLIPFSLMYAPFSKLQHDIQVWLLPSYLICLYIFSFIALYSLNGFDETDKNILRSFFVKNVKTR